MITPDEIHLWLGIPAAIILWTTVIALWFRNAAVDPHPTYSRLDKLDGLDSRTDEVRHVR